MKFKSTFVLMGLIGLLVQGCGPSGPSKKTSKVNNKETNSSKKPAHVPGQVIVKGEKTAVSQAFSDLGVKGKIVNSDQYDVHTVEVHTSTDLKKLSANLEKSGGIDFAEPNYKVYLNRTPVDQYRLQQWALKNLGQDAPSGSKGKAAADIQAYKAWDLNTGSKEVIVAVLDTGVDYKHPDLKANMWVNEAEKNGIAGRDDDGNGYADDVYGWDAVSPGRAKPYGKGKIAQLGDPDPMDDQGHGTHCAGTIAAVGNNGTGVTGVAWKAKIMALKFLNKNGSGETRDAYNAFKYALSFPKDKRPHIISNSWGGSKESKLMNFIIQKARKSGILVVAAAGNSGDNNDITNHFPSNYPGVIAVAASDNKDQLAGFSSYGITKVHLAAPGVDILSTVPRFFDKSSAYAYRAWSGTSMATPHVAGALALLLSHEPSLKYQESLAKERLLATVDQLPQFSGRVSTGGRLNLYKLLKNERNKTIAKGAIKTKQLTWSVPRLHDKMFDKLWEVSIPKAESIRIKFDEIEADIPNFDLLAIYDQNYKLLYKIETNYPQGLTTPWFKGNKLFVRFANAKVKILLEKQKKFKRRRSAYRKGYRRCRKADDGSFVCTRRYWSKPQANHESHGFTIGSAEYVVASQSKPASRPVVVPKKTATE